MAYSINQNDIVEITFGGTIFLQKTMTVLHYRVVTAPAVNEAWDQLNSLCVDLKTALLYTNYLNLLSSNWHATEIRAQVVAPNRRPVVVVSAAFDGLNTFGSLTANASGVITKRTDVITHRTAPTKAGGVGSIHVPALPPDWMDDGMLTTGCQIAFATWVPNLLATRSIGTGGLMAPCLWHRQAGSPRLSDDVVAMQVQDEVRTMRRRTVGRGI